MKNRKGWSKEARNKGYSVERSAVLFYKKAGLLAFKIPNSSQVREWSKIDYVVIEKGVLGQGKFKKKDLKNKDKLLMSDMVSNYPASDLRLELAHREKLYARIKFEPIEK